MLQWDHCAPHMHSIYSQRMLYGLIFYWGDWNTFLFLYVLFCLFDHQTQFISRRIDLLQHTQHTTGKNSLNSFFVRSLFIVICLFVFFLIFCFCGDAFGCIIGWGEITWKLLHGILNQQMSILFLFLLIMYGEFVADSFFTSRLAHTFIQSIRSCE